MTRFTLCVSLLLIYCAVSAQFAPPEVIFETPIYDPVFQDAADLDGDGHVDVILLVNGRQLCVAWGGDNGYEYQKFDASYEWRNYSAVDLNGDGLHEMVGTAIGLDALLYYHNYGGRDFELINLLSGVTYVCALDYDEDQQVEVFYKLQGTICSSSILDQSLESPICHGSFPNQAEITIADLEGDGDLDILTNQLSIALAEDGELSIQEIGSPISPSDLLYEDIDEDGKLDILSGSNFDAELNWFKQGAEPTDFGTVHSIAIQEPMNDILFADVNGDGLRDLVYSMGNIELKVLEKLGPAEFADPVSLAEIEFNGFTAVDLDGDGVEQVLAYSTAKEYVAELKFGEAVQYLIGPYPSYIDDVVIANLDEDAWPEVLIANRSHKDVIALDNDAAGFAAGMDLLPDLPGVGSLLVAEHAFGEYLYLGRQYGVYRARLAGIFSYEVPELVYGFPFSSGSDKLEMAFLDCNNDEAVDLVVSPDFDESVYCFSGNLSGQIDTPAVATYPLNHAFLHDDFKIGSFTDHGAEDLLFQKSNDILYLRDLGEQGYEGGELIANPPSYSVIDFAVEDIDDDERDEVVVIARSIYNQGDRRILVYDIAESNSWIELAKLNGIGHSLLVSDFDLDLDKDIVVLSDFGGNSKLELLENIEGVGFIANESSFIPIENASGAEMLCLDYDLDGDEDFLLYPESRAKVILLVNRHFDFPLSAENRSADSAFACSFVYESQQLLLHYEGDEPTVLRLFDTQGRKLLEKSLDGCRTVPLGNYGFAEGVYLYQLERAGAVVAGSVVLR